MLFSLLAGELKKHTGSITLIGDVIRYHGNVYVKIIISTGLRPWPSFIITLEDRSPPLLSDKTITDNGRPSP